MCTSLRKKRPRIVLEVTSPLKEEIKKYAEELNMTMRQFCMSILWPEIIRRRRIQK